MPKRKSNWNRRNTLAREKGYKNYYDYRAHNYGAISASEPRLTGAALRKARGHMSGADLAAEIRKGDTSHIIIFHKKTDPPKFDVLYYDEDGDETTFYVTGAGSVNRIRKAIDEMGLDKDLQVMGTPKSKKEWEKA